MDFTMGDVPDRYLPHNTMMAAYMTSIWMDEQPCVVLDTSDNKQH